MALPTQGALFFPGDLPSRKAGRLNPWGFSAELGVDAFQSPNVRPAQSNLIGAAGRRCPLLRVPAWGGTRNRTRPSSRP
jgi:hypothetical protein